MHVVHVGLYTCVSGAELISYKDPVSKTKIFTSWSYGGVSVVLYEGNTRIIPEEKQNKATVIILSWILL